MKFQEALIHVLNTLPAEGLTTMEIYQKVMECLEDKKSMCQGYCQLGKIIARHGSVFEKHGFNVQQVKINGKKVYKRVINYNVIPPLTHDLSRYWNQPRTEDILIDNTHAVMSKKVFDALAEYSCSVPSGVYEGKMWKACPSSFFHDAPKGWLSDRPESCSNNGREIIIVE
jgi:hypothetical protein